MDYVSHVFLQLSPLLKSWLSLKYIDLIVRENLSEACIIVRKTILLDVVSFNKHHIHGSRILTVVVYCQ